MKQIRWTYTAASTIGTAHQRRDERCQDHSYVGCLPIDEVKEFLFAAVADGAGSAKFAAKGARLAIRILRKEIQRCLTKGEPFRTVSKLFWFS